MASLGSFSGNFMSLLFTAIIWENGRWGDQLCYGSNGLMCTYIVDFRFSQKRALLEEHFFLFSLDVVDWWQEALGFFSCGVKQWRVSSLPNLDREQEREGEGGRGRCREVRVERRERAERETCHPVYGLCGKKKKSSCDALRHRADALRASPAMQWSEAGKLHWRARWQHPVKRLNEREREADAAKMDCTIKVGACPVGKHPRPGCRCCCCARPPVVSCPPAATATASVSVRAEWEKAVMRAPHSFLLVQNFLFLPVRGRMSALY